MVWRFPDEKFRRDMIKPTQKGRDLTIMVMGFIGDEGAGPIVVMVRDPSAAKKGYSQISYRAALDEAEEYLPDGFTLLQDNAPIQNARASQKKVT